MENSIKYLRGKKGAQRKMRQIEKQIEKFYSDNPQIADAMKLFNISNEEYEKAINSLYGQKTYTANSTIGGAKNDNDLG